MVPLDQDKDWSDAGADQIHALAHAIEHSGLKLDSLTLAGISHTIFDRSTERGYTMSHALRAVVRPLRRLRLFIQAWPPEVSDRAESSSSSDLNSSGSDSSEDIHQTEAIRLKSVSVFEQGHARKVLAEARELRALKLELPVWDPSVGLPKHVRLDRTLRDVHFPHLYELALSQCAVKGNWLVDFLLRHKTTLRRISLSNMSIAKARPSWRGVFARISCQFPHLQETNLYGEFSREERPSILFEYKGSTDSSYGKAMSDFIVRGGTYPSKNSIRRRPHESDADERKDGTPRDLPDANIPSDDPASDYESDEYDDHV